MTERTLSAQLMHMVHDLKTHRPLMYWTDFLASIAAFWTCLALLIHLAATGPLAALCFAFAVLALYRASCFMHEIVHLPRTALPGFRWAWNLLCGIPMLLPFYFYTSHIDHHATRTYGTAQDPEYLPRLKQSAASMAMLLGGTLLSPVTLWFRFVVIAPLAWCVPAVRRMADQRLSSVTLHPHYRADAERLLRPVREVRMAEVLTALWGWGAAVLVAGGVMPVAWAATFLAVVLCVLLINMVRTALTHHYEHDGTPMDHAAQIADSATWGKGGLLVELFAPLGLRYHALHHLFPYLPYHALGTAHRRLMQGGPAAMAYQRTDCSVMAGAVTVQS